MLPFFFPKSIFRKHVRTDADAGMPEPLIFCVLAPLGIVLFYSLVYGIAAVASRRRAIPFSGHVAHDTTIVLQSRGELASPHLSHLRFQFSNSNILGPLGNCTFLGSRDITCRSIESLRRVPLHTVRARLITKLFRLRQPPKYLNAALFFPQKHIS